MFICNIFKTSTIGFIVTVSLILFFPVPSWQRCCNSQETPDISGSGDRCNCAKETACGKPAVTPCECHAPDFIYNPKKALFKDKYTRIQDCQSKMVIRPGDEFWWVSTRHLPLQSSQVELCYHKYENGTAKTSSLDELKTAQREKPNLINFVYIHENRADVNKSEMRFWQTYNILINEAPGAPPIRYIFFSWPADQIRGQIKDVKEKAIVCDYHAYYLAWFLCQIKDFNRVSLGGYSYGCRMALDALHIAGGGSKKCRKLPEAILVKKPTFRAAFVATAMQNQSSKDGGLYKFAYQTLDHITLLNNSNDQILRIFHLLSENGASAIGKEGVCVSLLPDGGKRLTQIDACYIAGRSHKLEDYYKSEKLRQKIRDSIFWR